MKPIIPEEWNIPNQIRERFGDSVGRQRAMFAEGHLLLALHEPPGPNDRERQGKILWRAPNGSWSCNTDGSVNNLLKRHVAAFAKKVDELENDLQKATCATDYFKLLQAIAPLHRTSRNLHNTLQQAREMMADDREIIVARDAAGDAERGFELLLVDAKNGLDFMVAQKAEQESERTYEMAVSAHRLNVLAALFFPITAISSVFGMNFASGLEKLPHPMVFWGVLIFGFLCGLTLTVTILRKPAAIGTQASDKSQGKAITSQRARADFRERRV